MTRIEIISGIRRMDLAALLAWSFFLAITAVSIARPLVGYDSWWYHLPFSSFLWNIGGGKENFRLDPLSAQRFLGFPHLMEWVQGGIWKATGSINSVILPQLAATIFYFTSVPRLLGFNRTLLIGLFFASPLILIHFCSTYVDLTAAICLALSFFIFEGFYSGRLPITPLRLICLIALMGMAGNIKYQALISLAVLSALYIGLAILSRRLPLRQRLTLVAAVIIGATIANTTTLDNFIEYGNPVYPLQVEVGSHILFYGPESPDFPDADKPTYALQGHRLVHFPSPIEFALSITELDWVMRGVAPWYNIDSLTGKAPRRGGPGRTGGLGAIFIAFNFGLLALQLLPGSKTVDSRQRVLVLLCVILIAATAFLPRSFELRYWLFLPLIFIPINSRYLTVAFCNPSYAALIVGFVATYGIATAVLSPKSALLEPGLGNQQNRAALVPIGVRDAWQAKGIFCDATNKQLFQYSTASTGLKGKLSRRWKDCDLGQ